jgi:hypothetical protein
MPVVRAPTPQCPTGAYGHARSPRSAAEREWVQVCPHLRRRAHSLRSECGARSRLCSDVGFTDSAAGRAGAGMTLFHETRAIALSHTAPGIPREERRR